MTSSVFVTDSQIAPEGSGGGVVSDHEFKALIETTSVQSVYQHVGKLLIEEVYPRNPFIYDSYIASLLPETPVDLAHFYGAGFPLTMKLLKRSGAKVTATVAAHDLDLSLEEWRGFQFFEPPPPHLTNSFLFHLLCKGLTDHADMIICPSTNSKSFLQRKFGLKDEKFAVIPHGVDLPKQWSTKRESRFLVFHISQFGPDKGQKYLVEAWKTFISQSQPSARYLVMAGSQFFNDFVKIDLGFNAVDLGINCFGYLPKEQKEDFYSNAAVYVQPSVTEGFSLTTLEAMSHGTPVIVTEGVGAKDVVEDKKDGFIVPVRNPKEIADRLLWLYENPSEREKMGRNARLKAEQYSWSIIEEKYKKLWMEVVGR